MLVRRDFGVEVAERVTQVNDFDRLAMPFKDKFIPLNLLTSDPMKKKSYLNKVKLSIFKPVCCQ